MCFKINLDHRLNIMHVGPEGLEVVVSVAAGIVSTRRSVLLIFSGGLCTEVWPQTDTERTLTLTFLSGGGIDRSFISQL